MSPVKHNTLTSQTLYAELLEQMLALEASRTTANLAGSFTKRKVKGRIYHYFVYRDVNNRYQQVYLGPDNETICGLIDKVRSEKKSLKADIGRIEELCAALASTGAMATPAPHARLIQALADCGSFRFGMVLVGSHAFTVLGNMLGVHWGESHKTHDIDFAYDPDVDVGVADAEEIDIPEVLQKLQMGFIPVPQLNHRQPSTSFRVRGKELRIDFLMPLMGKGQDKPIYQPHLHTAVQPLRFMDYLIEEAEQGVVIANRGILVNVPNAGRFALHKLIISQVRENQTKAGKDVYQAAQLCEVLLEARPGNLKKAYKVLAERGPKWVALLKGGLARMKKEHPEAGSATGKYLGI